MSNKFEIPAWDLLKESYEDCLDDDASIPYTIQYMQDYANASYDEVMDYIRSRCKESK